MEENSTNVLINPVNPHTVNNSDKGEKQALLGARPSSKTALLNVAHLGISFCILFTAFNTLQVCSDEPYVERTLVLLQSFEANVNKDLGLWSLSTLYFFFSLSTLVSGAIVSTLKERYFLYFFTKLHLYRISLVLGATTYLIYGVANLYVRCSMV